MRRCSICRKVRIVAGTLDDYRQLAHYHYRDAQPAGVTAVFSLKPEPALAGASRGKAIGVVVYSTASCELELRNVATNNFFAGFDRSTKLGMVNKHIRRISRVIIEPRFRGLGLASRLVRQTMPRMNVPIIEAVAVMGLVNPFLEKAGMKAYSRKMSAHNTRLIEALSAAGIEDAELIDAEQVQHKLDRLGASKAEFIEREIKCFLQRYRGHRDMQPGSERTRYVLSKLSARPTYYIWFNPRLAAPDKRRAKCSENYDE